MMTLTPEQLQGFADEFTGLVERYGVRASVLCFAHSSMELLTNCDGKPASEALMIMMANAIEQPLQDLGEKLAARKHGQQAG